MFMHGLESDSDLTKNKFLEMMSKMFNTGKGEEWEHVWNSFDRSGRGVANVGSIIKVWEKYELV